MRLRAETTTLLLAVALSGCATPPPATRDLEIGVHRVRLVPPVGWEILEHGREHRFRREESVITLADFGPATSRGMARELRDARRVWLAGRRKDAFKRAWALQGPPLTYAAEGKRQAYWHLWTAHSHDFISADSAAIGVWFDDIIDATEELSDVSAAIKTEYVLARFPQSNRKEIARRDQRSIQGRVWTEVHTWNRVSHMDPGRVAFAEDGDRFLVLAIDHGPIEVAGPVFEGLLASIETRADSSAAR